MTPVVGHRVPGPAGALVRRSVVLVLLLIIPACSRPFYVGTDGVRPGRRPAPPPTDVKGLPVPELAWMWVQAKEAPSTLIAHGGNRCTVTEDRYARTQIGDRVLCAWQPGSK